jgi:plasmid stabilization system protein ParE
MKPVVLAPTAEVEIADAAIAYERTRTGLGRDFVDEVRAVSRNVARAPDAVAETSGGIRCAATPRFPYRVIFRERGSRIEVLAVLPTQAEAERLLVRLATRTLAVSK